MYLCLKEVNFINENLKVQFHAYIYDLVLREKGRTFQS